jgi:hypothetical protein
MMLDTMGRNSVGFEAWEEFWKQYLYFLAEFNYERFEYTAHSRHLL